MKKRHLTLAEKRDWLANIFRDESGEYSQADKFKAMVEDTRLAQLEEEKVSPPPASHAPPPGLLDLLPPPVSLPETPAAEERH